MSCDTAIIRVKSLQPIVYVYCEFIIKVKNYILGKFILFLGYSVAAGKFTDNQYGGDKTFQICF